MFLLLFFFLFNLHSDCLKLESYYIIGDYENCIKQNYNKYDKNCTYVKALCYLEKEEYDEANYIFSKLIDDKKSFISELSFNSMVETYFLKGNYEKVNVFTDEIQEKGTENFSDFSYTKLLNKFMLIKMFLFNKEPNKAKKLLDEIKNAETDNFLYFLFLIK